MVHVLHLRGTEHSNDRYASITQQLIHQNIANYKIWDGLEDKYNVCRAINKSHKQIIKWAKDNSMPNICILEDDCVFTSLGAFDFFMKNKPIEFDMYLGSLSSGKPDEKGVVKWFRGMTLYMVNGCFYDIFLSVKDDENIDAALSNKGNYIVCPEAVCYQKDGYSYHKKEMKQYSKLSNQYKIYGKT